MASVLADKGTVGGRGWLLWMKRVTTRGEGCSASMSTPTQLPSGPFTALHLHGGDRRGIFGEDGGCLAANPLGGLLDQKMVSSELLLLPPLSRQFRHGQEKEGMWGLPEELYLSRLSSTGKGSSRRLAGSCQAPDKRFRWQ
ncbi:hypothetical protein BHE74_00057936 [Ensete ventricosum]|nr:hypothetical protein BHE74_00057936 [Ensete ventricosum]